MKTEVGVSGEEEEDAKRLMVYMVILPRGDVGGWKVTITEVEVRAIRAGAITP